MDKTNYYDTNKVDSGGYVRESNNFEAGRGIVGAPSTGEAPSVQFASLPAKIEGVHRWVYRREQTQLVQHQIFQRHLFERLLVPAVAAAGAAASAAAADMGVVSGIPQKLAPPAVKRRRRRRRRNRKRRPRIGSSVDIAPESGAKLQCSPQAGVESTDSDRPN